MFCLNVRNLYACRTLADIKSLSTMEAANGLRGLVYCVWIEAAIKAVLLLLTLRQCLSISLGVNTKAAVVHTHNCPKSIPYTSTLIYKIDPQNLICKNIFQLVHAAGAFECGEYH